ncbi:MAG: D-aminoacylase, partial [Chloroflexota bacterium]|nr:D-aminoacylase [Chloroflexota bacterium]
MLDYLIKNGRIVDGSGKKLYIASIGISNGKIITNVSEDSEAIEIIDANKKVVTPGFIDVHSHDDFNVITDKNV